MSARLERIQRAIATVNKHHSLGDAVYDVRERHGSDDVDGKPYSGDSWLHPIVVEYSAAVAVLRDERCLS